MIYERGRVIDVRPGRVGVDCDSRRDCARCAAGRGCGGALFSRMLGRRNYRVEALTSGPALAVGDTVQLALPARTILRAAALAYLVPLTGLVAGTLGGHALSGDTTAVAGGVAGFAIAFAAARWATRRIDPAVLHPAARRL